MTAGEKNFALWIEHLLNKMDAAKYRQLNIETLMALAALADRTPDLKINDYLVLDVIIGHAVRLAWLDRVPDRADFYEEDKAAAWKAFYDTSPQVCGAYARQSFAVPDGFNSRLRPDRFAIRRAA